MELLELVALMIREKFKWRHHKNESTDTGHKDGATRSSKEGAVMALEQRGGIIQPDYTGQPQSGKNPNDWVKPFKITKRQVYEAYKRVKANRGAAGVDHQSIQDFGENLSANLYKLWNRLSSGSYHPPPVLRVEIPKGNGAVRALGIPTVADRIAQMVVKEAIEPNIDRQFHPDSYGYRPLKSAHQAVGKAKKRCWKHPWVLDMDIKAFFDTIDHKLLMRAVDKHVEAKWQRLYIERWVKAPVRHPDGQLESRSKGTPQGGVISPLLANLFLHYAFDLWMSIQWPEIKFERYADDIICHCSSESEAMRLKQELEERFDKCGLKLHPVKTKIIYCKSSYFKQDYSKISFDFLGFTFRPRPARSFRGNIMVGFTPAISGESAKCIRQTISSWELPRKQNLGLESLSKLIGSRVQGWINYYGKFGLGELRRILFHLDGHIVRWVQRKYKRLNRRRRAIKWLRYIRKVCPTQFTHWRLRLTTAG
jgi:RNA-directed DNA polymerase